MENASVAVPTAEMIKSMREEIKGVINARYVTRYVSVAGLIILLYDHLLLFEEEVRLIWSSRTTRAKILFLVNRYMLPIALCISAYPISGITKAGLNATFCKVWLATVSFLLLLSLFISNLFVLYRVNALWSDTKVIYRGTVSLYIATYVSVILFLIYGTVRLLPHISYSQELGLCSTDLRPTINIVAYAVPILFDVVLFILTCWNGLTRPRRLHTAIIGQLYIDGALYFVLTMSLRLANIIVLARANLAYAQVGFYFLWAVIPAVLNRMLIMISRSVHSEGFSYHPAEGYTPHARREIPFELTPVTTRADSLLDSEGSLTEYPGQPMHVSVSVETQWVDCK